jgi:uncharacterized delta-60 repeat protein
MAGSRRALIVVAVFVAVAFGLPGAGAVREASAQISVTAADPATADQGTISLPVTIKGSGFKKGAKAKFYVTGTSDPGGITVSSTRFVSSTQLTATIDVAATAVVAGFDIAVTNADGRTGKGTELFKVIEKVDACALPDPVPSPSSDTSYGPGNPGFLDANFGSGTGRVIGLRAFKAAGHAAIHWADGEARIVMAGSIQDPCSNVRETWAVARFLGTGAADDSFGAGGVVTTPFPGAAHAVEVAVDGAGRLVVIGFTPPKTGADRVATVVRYNGDGSLDTTFGMSGVVRLPYGKTLPYSTVRSVAVQSDNKIVIAGTSTPTTGLDVYLEVFRLNVNGTLDSTLTGGGRYVYKDQPKSFGLRITTQGVGSEERLVVAGQASKTGYYRDYMGTVWRFTSAGTLDSSFGVGGVATVDFEGDQLTLDDVVVDGSRLLVTGGVYPAADIRYSYLALARFDERGDPDLTFGSGGAVLMPSATATSGSGVAIQGDGRILVAGDQYFGDVRHAAIWRFETTGLPDVTFGPGGVVTNLITDQSRGVLTGGLLLQADGTVVTVGGLWAGEKNIPYPFLARFWQ